MTSLVLKTPLSNTKISTLEATNLITNLYQAVDEKSTSKLSTFLADDLRFQLGNFDPVRGKKAVLEANDNFFQIIDTMTHRIDSIWAQGDDIICKGEVHYKRLDQSELSLPFATVLEIKNSLIQDYQVYVDVTPL
ncbi:nuclear transport factor 2 family protein [uncultured Kiloniella sp.]|uniref:nuclear transport factor 2 family protein n=1 Tax=uncultured Kiloniella sp. TaxID=1133091 RepID=UPI00260988A0|nr:nuclear transport factor 2 family protein [uncultured Kiloniella sp.]